MTIARINGIDMYYNVYGNGDPVVFIHGVAATSRVWDYQIDEISKGYTMIVYDLRGSGRSQKTVDISHTVDLLSDDLKGLIDYLGYKRVSIVGLSLGAAVAMKFAIKYPDSVYKLILSGAFVELNGILNFFRRHFVNLIGKMLNTKFFWKLGIKIMLPSALPIDLTYYYKNIFSIDKHEVMKDNQILASYKITDELSKIAAPTLLVYGQYEKIMHKYGRIIAGKIRVAQMQVIPGVGHGWNVEAPSLFSNVVMNFLKD